MAGERNFSPLPYQATQPWSIESTLAHDASPSPGSAYQMLLGYQRDREQGQAGYADYMRGVNALQQQHLQQQQEEARLQHAGPLVVNSYGKSGVMDQLGDMFPGVFGQGRAGFSKSIGVNDAVTRADLVEKSANAASKFSDAGQVLNADNPDFVDPTTGLSSSSTGINPRVQAAEMGNQGRYQVQSEKTYLPGAGPDPVKRVDKASSPNSPVSGTLKPALSAKGRQQEQQKANDIPLQQQQQAPTQPATATQPAPAGVDDAKFKAWVQSLATVNPQMAERIAKGGFKFTPNPDGTVTAYDEAGRPIIVRPPGGAKVK